MSKLVAPYLFVALLAAAARGSDEGPVLEFSLDKVSDSRVKDISGNKNHGRVHGGAEIVRWENGRAMRFDGEDDFIECIPSATLDIERAGTLELWCRADKAQGGLACRTTGGGWVDNRLVLAINTYRQTRELTWVLADGHVFQKGATEAPPDGTWYHVALTCDGGLVKLIIDGLLVDTVWGSIRQEVSPQVVTPEVTDVPLWIGKSVGLGAPFFSGLISRVRVYNRALSERELLAHFKAEAQDHAKDTSHLARVGVDCHAYPRYGLLSARLDVRGLWPLPEGATVAASLHRLGESNAITEERQGSISSYGRPRVVFAVPKLPTGEYEVVARVVTPDGRTIGKGAGEKVEWARPPKWLGDGSVKMLNNMVFELANIDGPGKQENFYHFRDGWVFVSATAGDGAKLFIGSEETPAIVYPSGREVAGEAMRYLPEGHHSVRVVGGRCMRLVVRAIPEIVIHQPARPHVKEFGDYDTAFVRKYMLANVNANINGHDYGGNHPFPAEEWARPRI